MNACNFYLCSLSRKIVKSFSVESKHRKPQRTQKIAFLGAVFLSFSLSFSAQSGIAIGKITTDEGKPIENVCVDITQDGKVIESVVCNKDGRYKVEGLAEGEYDFIVYYRMENKKLPKVKIFKDKPAYQKIKLVKKDPVIPYYSGDIDLAVSE